MLIKIAVIKNSVLILPGGSADLVLWYLALCVARLYLPWHMFWIGGMFLMLTFLCSLCHFTHRNDNITKIPPIQKTCQKN